MLGEVCGELKNFDLSLLTMRCKSCHRSESFVTLFFNGYLLSLGLPR